MSRKEESEWTAATSEMRGSPTRDNAYRMVGPQGLETTRNAKSNQHSFFFLGDVGDEIRRKRAWFRGAIVWLCD